MVERDFVGKVRELIDSSESKIVMAVMVLLLKNAAFTEGEMLESNLSTKNNPELNLILKEFKWVMKSYQVYC